MASVNSAMIRVHTEVDLLSGLLILLRATTYEKLLEMETCTTQSLAKLTSMSYACRSEGYISISKHIDCTIYYFDVVYTSTL